jgi:hypothetical protein
MSFALPRNAPPGRASTLLTCVSERPPRIKNLLHPPEFRVKQKSAISWALELLCPNILGRNRGESFYWAHSVGFARLPRNPRSWRDESSHPETMPCSPRCSSQPDVCRALFSRSATGRPAIVNRWLWAWFRGGRNCQRRRLWNPAPTSVTNRLRAVSSAAGGPRDVRGECGPVPSHRWRRPVRKEFQPRLSGGGDRDTDS